MSLDDWHEKPIGDALAAIFMSALKAHGFELVSVSEDRVALNGPRLRLEAAYVPRGGELAVYVIPHGSGERLQVLRYLRATGSPAASELGEAVAESSEDAVRHAAIYAAALRDSPALLAGEPSELDRARGSN